MLERFVYRNHVNDEFDFGRSGVYINENDLRDFSWVVTSDNNRISSLTRGIVTRTIPVVIVCSSEEEGVKKRNEIFEVCEKDALALEYGRIIIGDYYLKCFVTGSKKSNYLKHKSIMEVSLTVTTDYSAWVREASTTFVPASQEEQAGTDWDYNSDYLYDYSSFDMTNRKINNTSFVPTAFRMIIYGKAVNPTINIANHSYGVDANVESNEYLVIDSMQKKIYKIQNSGEKINCYNERNRDSYIFEKIPVGKSAVTWEGDFGFDLILLEERSEPKWT